MPFYFFFAPTSLHSYTSCLGSGHKLGFLKILVGFTSIPGMALHSLTSDVARVEPLPEISTSLHWWTAYGSHNHTRDDQLWKAINPSHGFVAIDRQTATDHHLPVSMYLPSDDSKGVYLLEAYHQLHCLVCAKANLRRQNAEKGLRKRYARVSGKRLRTGSMRTRQAIWSIVLTRCER